MENFSLFLFLVFCSNLLFAQQRELELSAQRMDDNSVDINFEKTAPGTFTVVIDFNNLRNTIQPFGKEYTIVGYKGKVLTLKPEDKNQGIGYGYSYSYIRGKYKPRLDKDFCYVLPYSPGVNCIVEESGFANEKYFGATKPDDWKSYFFSTTDEEPVTAIRKGTVVNVEDIYNDDGRAEFTTNKNSLIIEHEDGSLARYVGFKNGSFKVKTGDEVFPNDTLASNTISNGRYGVGVYIYFLSSTNFNSPKTQTLSTQKSLYSFITPKFLTASGTAMVLDNNSKQVSASNLETITKEMSKRQIKKYKSK